MKQQNPFTFFKSFSLGVKDGILILVILATISPFVYREVLQRTSTSSEVVAGSIDTDLPIRPSTATPEANQPTATPTPTQMPVATHMPTPTAAPTTAAPTAVPDTASAAPVLDGGFIQLSIDNVREGLWTQVQWLAGDGNWYNVNGWGGKLTDSLNVLWFVGKDHLGAEPAFRWQVYDGEGGALLTTSGEFHLPTNTRETVYMTVSLPTP